MLFFLWESSWRVGGYRRTMISSVSMLCATGNEISDSCSGIYVTALLYIYIRQMSDDRDGSGRVHGHE
jgi:hypothetical protein